MRNLEIINGRMNGKGRAMNDEDFLTRIINNYCVANPEFARLYNIKQESGMLDGSIKVEYGLTSNRNSEPIEWYETTFEDMESIARSYYKMLGGEIYIVERTTKSRIIGTINE